MVCELVMKEVTSLLDGNDTKVCVHVCVLHKLPVHTCRKRTLFHCTWVILVISLECSIEITPDFLRPFMND